MGVYRTVFADLICARCAAVFGADVQFYTGDDRDMAVYAEGEAAPDLPPGARYEGTADRFCGSCMERWRTEEKRSSFEALAEQVSRGELAVHRLRWTSEGPTGITGVADAERPVSADELIALGATTRPAHGWASLAAVLGELELALTHGAVDVFPVSGTPGEQVEAWWRELADRVRMRLSGRGWPAPADAWSIDVPVVVEASGVVRIERAL